MGIYIAVIANERVVKYDSNGTYFKDIKYQTKGDNAYQAINEMATDCNDNLWISNPEKSSIDKYNSDGKFVLSIDLRNQDIRWREDKG